MKKEKFRSVAGIFSQTLDALSVDAGQHRFGRPIVLAKTGASRMGAFADRLGSLRQALTKYRCCKAPLRGALLQTPAGQTDSGSARCDHLAVLDADHPSRNQPRARVIQRRRRQRSARISQVIVGLAFGHQSEITTTSSFTFHAVCGGYVSKCRGWHGAAYHRHVHRVRRPASSSRRFGLSGIHRPRRCPQCATRRRPWW
jgi:hypothetical protein